MVVLLHDVNLIPGCSRTFGIHINAQNLPQRPTDFAMGLILGELGCVRDDINTDKQLLPT
jgi:hypothetical protein